MSNYGFSAWLLVVTCIYALDVSEISGKNEKDRIEYKDRNNSNVIDNIWSFHMKIKNEPVKFFDKTYSLIKIVYIFFLGKYFQNVKPILMKFVRTYIHMISRMFFTRIVFRNDLHHRGNALEGNAHVHFLTFDYWGGGHCWTISPIFIKLEMVNYVKNIYQNHAAKQL